MQHGNETRLPFIRRQILVLGAALLIAATGVVSAGELATSWQLTDLYPSDEAWEQARTELPGIIDRLEQHRGKLAEGSGELKAALDLLSLYVKEADRLGVYANLNSDLDLRKPVPQGMRQAINQQVAELSARASWVNPEILSLPAATISSYLAADPGLQIYRRYLEQLEQRRPHTLDTEGEKLLGLTGLLRGDAIAIGSLLRNAEIPWETITLADGSTLRVDPSGYSRGRALANRDDRVKTYEAFYRQLTAFQQTLAQTVAATLKAHLFTTKVRHFDSTLDAALSDAEIDPAVYQMLIEETNRALPSLHRYLRLRARMLGVDDLAYSDLYPSLVPQLERSYSWQESVEQVLAAFAPMGEDYVKYLQEATAKGWIDVYPHEGKRSGAYMAGGAYDVHPYMLLNHLDDYDSASTFAHEAGHMMHSALSNANQPFLYADYEAFVAEVASTTQEWLFFRYSLDHAANDTERLAILGSFLESMRTTVFRQTMFAEFELAIHRLVEQGKPATADALNSIYLDLLRRYHGHDEGICRIDDTYQVEWAFIPHFHLNYYVFTYATSFIASAAFSQQILDGENGGVERYLNNLLSTGSALPPVETLQAAGVDMTSPAPFRASFAAMEGIMDQIEAIIDRQ